MSRIGNLFKSVRGKITEPAERKRVAISQRDYWSNRCPRCKNFVGNILLYDVCPNCGYNFRLHPYWNEKEHQNLLNKANRDRERSEAAALKVERTADELYAKNLEEAEKERIRKFHEAEEEWRKKEQEKGKPSGSLAGRIIGPAKRLTPSSQRARDLDMERILGAERKRRKQMLEAVPEAYPELGKFFKSVEKPAKGIRCKACGAIFDEKLNRCPSCGTISPTIDYRRDYERQVKAEREQRKEWMDIRTRKPGAPSPAPVPRLGEFLDWAGKKEPTRIDRIAGLAGRGGGAAVSVLGRKTNNPFSKYTCPYCNNPLRQIANRWFCIRESCPYSHPQACPGCGGELRLEVNQNSRKEELICSNKECEFHSSKGGSAKLHQHVKDLGFGLKEERLNKIHGKKVFRSAIIMALGAVPMVFPGGYAGLSFMFGIWSIALNMFPSVKPKDTMPLFLKALGRFLSIMLFAGGVYFLGIGWVALVMLLAGYYTLPTGVAEYERYKKVLGVLRTILAGFLVLSIWFLLGGPPMFKASLALYAFAFLFSIPIKKGEVLEAIIFVFSVIAATILGLIALGSNNMQIMFGFGIISISMIMYTVSKIPILKEKEKEASEEHKEEAKQSDQDAEEKRKREREEEEREWEEAALKQERYEGWQKKRKETKEKPSYVS